MEELVIFFRMLLGTILLTSAIEKIRKKNEHKAIVVAYKIIPEYTDKYFIVVEILVELVVGLFLIIGYMLKLSSLLAIALLVTYTLAILINIYRGKKEMSCGCGGVVGDHKISWKLVFRNALLMLLGIYLLINEDAFLDVYQLNFGITEMFAMLLTWMILLIFLISLNLYKTKEVMAMLLNKERKVN